MGVQNLGKKKTRLCEKILGQKIIRAHTTHRHFVAICWTDRHHAGAVNYKTMEVLEPPTHQGDVVAWLDNYIEANK